MADVFTKKKRSQIMANVRGKNNALERLVFDDLKKQKINFSRHFTVGRISIDIADRKRKIAIFIDGDFWHGYRFTTKSNKYTPFWREKIQNNMKRDRRTRLQLRRAGWRVLRVWQHDLKGKKQSSTLQKIAKYLTNVP